MPKMGKNIEQQEKMASTRVDPFRTDLARLGLQEDPFQLSADPRFLYLGEEHQEVYKTIQGAILKRRGLALVTGKPGTGKSSLARYTYDRLFGRDGIDVAYIDTSNFDTRASAAKKIGTSFNTLNIEIGHSYSDQMENFKHQVVQANKQGHLVVLLLDDAQKLKRPHLEMLHEMYNFDYGEKAITVIAFGEDAAVKNFYRYPSISSRLYTIQSLNPVSYETTLQMVGFRLQVAGRTSPLFTEDALRNLYEVSTGIPREIVIVGAMAIDRLVETSGNMIDTGVMDPVADEYLQIRVQRLNG
jgi:general secretion pathway protein A